MSNHACFWPCLLLYFFGLCPLQVERTLIYIYTVYYTTARASLCVCECGSVCVLVIFSKILPQINMQLRVLSRSLSLSTFFYTSLYEQKRVQRWLHRMSVTACHPVGLQGVRSLGQPDCRVDTLSVSTSWHVGSLHPEKQPQRLRNACWHLITTCICSLDILPRLTFTWSNLGKGSLLRLNCPCGLRMHLPKIANCAWRKHMKHWSIGAREMELFRNFIWLQLRQLRL